MLKEKAAQVLEKLIKCDIMYVEETFMEKTYDVLCDHCFQYISSSDKVCPFCGNEQGGAIKKSDLTDENGHVRHAPSLDYYDRRRYGR